MKLDYISAYHKVRDAYKKIPMYDLTRAEYIDDMMAGLKHMVIPMGRRKWRVPLIRPLSATTVSKDTSAFIVDDYIEFDVVTDNMLNRYLA